jgi:hypothetical protein
MNAAGFSFVPRLCRYTVAGVDRFEFTWWKFRLHHPFIDCPDLYLQMAVGETVPPIFRTLLKLRESASLVKAK